MKKYLVTKTDNLDSNSFGLSFDYKVVEADDPESALGLMKPHRSGDYSVLEVVLTGHIEVEPAKVIAVTVTYGSGAISKD